MREIRVRFNPSGDKNFRVQFFDESGSERGVGVDFTPSLSDDDFENLRWYLEEYMDLPDGGSVVRAEGIERQLHQWGRQLYEGLFTQRENRALLQELLDSPEPRELTIATDRSELPRLPWELVADDAGNLAQRLSVRRQLATPERTEAHSVALPLRLLYIVSRPSDAGFIDPRMTSKSLIAALDPLGGNVRIDFCRPPTLAQMEEMLREAQAAEEPYHVVNFDGHGNFLPEAQIGGLYFEKSDDGSAAAKADLVPADRLGNILATHRIPLVVLGACRSATLGKMSVFRSVAPRLIQSGVGSVLSMGHAVHVEADRILFDRFYRELVRGTTIGHAVAQSRSALIGSPSRWIESGPQGRTISLEDWFLPHLYQRARLYQQALQLFQEAGNAQGVTQTFNLLGSLEDSAGRLSEARVWYEKSRELANNLQDQAGLAGAAQNIGIVCQTEGEAARERGDEAAARRHFEAARQSVEESQRIIQSLGNRPAEANSLGLLARIYLRLGDLDTAERHAHAACEIHESLGLVEVWIDYNTLAEIAEARGDSGAAADWAKKRDDLRAERKSRAGGGSGLPAKMLEALQQLALACARAGFAGGEFGPTEEEALATSKADPPPSPTSPRTFASSPPGSFRRSLRRCRPSCGKSWNN